MEASQEGQAMKHRNPKTPAEWREAVDAAQFLLLLDSAKQFGLVVGGPDVDQARALQLLKRGARRGIVPAPTDELLQKYLTTEGES